MIARLTEEEALKIITCIQVVQELLGKLVDKNGNSIGNKSYFTIDIPLEDKVIVFEGKEVIIKDRYSRFVVTMKGKFVFSLSSSEPQISAIISYDDDKAGMTNKGTP